MNLRFAVLGLATVSMLAFGGVAAAAGKDAMTAESQSAMSQSDSLKALKEGNARFTNEKPLDRDLGDQVEATSTGQYPYAVVLGCIDSRVPPELVFDTGIGDIFSARIAGNFANTDTIGSIEFATKLAGSNLVVVLGHTECGVVKGASDAAVLGNLTHTLSNLAPAIYAVGDSKGERSSKNKEFVHAVTEENVKLTVDALTDRSSVMAELVEDGKLMVVGAVYDTSTGKVKFMESCIGRNSPIEIYAPTDYSVGAFFV